MALATQCPHCHTTFRVASDQLKLRGGIVRCGSCQRIFDGNAHLIDLAALAASKKALEASSAEAAPAPAVAQAPEAAPVPESAPAPAADTPADTPAAEAPALPASESPGSANDFDAQPVYTLDFDHTFDPFGILPKAEPTLDGAPPAAPAAALDDGLAAEDAAVADDLPPAPDVQFEAEPPAAVDTQPEAPPGRIEPVIEPFIEPAAEAEAAPEPHAPEPETHAPEPEPPVAPAATPAPAHVPAYAYAPAGRIEPSFGLPVDEELVAQPLPDHEPEPEPPAEPAHALDTADATDDADTAAPSRPTPPPHAPDGDIPPSALPLRASAGSEPLLHGDTAHAAPKLARAKAAEARARRSKMTPTRIDTPKLRVPAEPDEPEFVKRSRRQEQSGRTMRIVMAAGAVILLLVLVAQVLLNFRNELAVRYPAARPLLSGLCFVAGCRVGLPAKAENLVIDDGELATLGPDTYTLTTQLRNQGKLMLAWPSIELELTDANNKPVLRRVFGPADYLPPGTAPASGFGAHAEQPVRLNFALTGLKPSSYHIFVFYP